MPTISIFIRNEDLPKWKALESKSAWLHNALNDVPVPSTRYGYLGKVTEVVVDSSERAPGYLMSTDKFTPRAPDPVTGYPCCQKAKPCKHWQWDGVRSAYLNELTGELREVV